MNMNSRKKNRFPVVSGCIVLIFIFLGLFGAYVVPYDPLAVSMKEKLLPPFFMEEGSFSHILGTDYLGRDILSRLICGEKISLLVSFTSVFAGGFLGTLLGIVSGYFGGIADKIIMRFCDAMLAFPSVLIALILSIGLKAGFVSAVIAIALSVWPRFTKVIRGEARRLKTSSFIVQTILIGRNSIQIIFGHILPNVMNTVIVLLVQVIGLSILTEASLSFLGLSVQPPDPTWGGMATDGRETFHVGWWQATFPALAIMITVIAFNMLGEWLKVHFDPKGGR